MWHTLFWRSLISEKATHGVINYFDGYEIKSLMWRMMISFHIFEHKLIDIQKMLFCCVYFQKADWKHLIWQIIKNYSTAIWLPN